MSESSTAATSPTVSSIYGSLLAVKTSVASSSPSALSKSVTISPYCSASFTSPVSETSASTAPLLSSIAYTGEGT